MNILFVGDIVGRAGRRAVRVFLNDLIEKHEVDFVIANGENAAGGFGITKKVAEELYGYGINFFTRAIIPGIIRIFLNLLIRILI
jgi:hypothetical protein